MASGELRVPQMLTGFCGGARSLPVEGATVAEALESAFAAHPLLRVHLLDEAGRVREHVLLFLNEEEIHDDLSAPLREGDSVFVLQAMSGG